jgi:hypothetical protein
VPLPRCATIVLLLAAMGCASAAPKAGITRDRALACNANGREIWRVTLKGRLPGQPPLLFETAIVELDAASGEILSVSKT